MRTHPLLFILFFLLLSGCAHHSVPQKKGAPLPVASNGYVRKLPQFNQLLVQGRIDVDLHTGYARPEVILRGDSRDIVHVITVIKNNTLLVSLENGYPKFGNVRAEIRGHYLSSFTYRGAGRITGSHLSTGSLDLSITNPGRTTLGGAIYLRKIEVNGPGFTEIDGVRTQNLRVKMTGKAQVKLVGIANISTLDLEGDGSLGMYWVRSDTLTLRAKDHAYVQLGGIATRLDMELWGNAHFNGRYLRVDSTFVKTHGHSIAEITSLKKQHTLATDASDIYFYEVPRMRTDFMAWNGAVLDMRDWNMPYLKEYSRYNK